MVYKSYLGLRFPLEIYTTCVRVLLIFTLSYSPQIIYQFGTRRRSGPFVGDFICKGAAQDSITIPYYFSICVIFLRFFVFLQFCALNKNIQDL